jgi:hypothetical protein
LPFYSKIKALKVLHMDAVLNPKKLFGSANFRKRVSKLQT